MDEFRRFLETPAGWVYLAKRVLAGARAVMREELRLEAWLKSRDPFNS
jgi:hypothetical protein